MKNMDGLPFLDGIISINQSVPPQKMPVYTVENLEIRNLTKRWTEITNSTATI